MIIAITAGGHAELREPDEFRSFKIVADGALSSAALGQALAALGALDSDGKTAWVKRDAVKRLRGSEAPPAWIAAFDNMIGSVRRFGWVNDDAGTVRAHIERA